MTLAILSAIVLMVRQRVVRLGNADLAIGAAAEFASHHEGDDARQVGLEARAPAGRTSAWRGR